MTKPKTLAEFRAAHDPDLIHPAKIKAALASLEKEFGPEGHEYDAQFRARTGLPPAQYTAYRDQFKDHQVMVLASGAKSGRRIVWVATLKAVKEFLKVPGVTAVE